MHPVVFPHEGVIGRQDRSLIGAREMDLAGVAGHHVSVGSAGFRRFNDTMAADADEADGGERQRAGLGDGAGH